MTADPRTKARNFFEEAETLTVSLHGPAQELSERSSSQFLKKAKAFFKKPVVYIAVGAALATAGSVSLLKIGAQDPNMRFYDDHYTIGSSIDSGHFFQSIDNRYNDLFEKGSRVFLFGNSETEAQFAGSLFGSHDGKILQSDISDLTQNGVDGINVRFSDAEGNPSECVVLINQNNFTEQNKSLVDILDQQMFHCFNHYTHALDTSSENGIYQTYLQQSASQAFATLMRIKDHGQPSMEEIVQNRLHTAAVLFNPHHDLDYAVSQSTTSVTGIAETQSQRSLENRSASDIAKKTVGMTKLFAMPPDKFHQFRDSVRIIREAAAGNPIDVKEAPPYLKMWAFMFNGYELSQLGSEYQNIEPVLDYYLGHTKSIEYSKSPEALPPKEAFEKNLNEWRDNNSPGHSKPFKPKM